MKTPQSAKNVSSDSENFTNFMRRLMQVPHLEIRGKETLIKSIESPSGAKALGIFIHLRHG